MQHIEDQLRILQAVFDHHSKEVHRQDNDGSDTKL